MDETRTLEYTGPILVCPECQKKGLKSSAVPGECFRTLMWCPPFYDEDGRLHNHDINTYTQDYSCSNGHSWRQNLNQNCWCGWPDSGLWVKSQLERNVEGNVDGRDTDRA